jgi:hypothetical protein
MLSRRCIMPLLNMLKADLFDKLEYTATLPYFNRGYAALSILRQGKILSTKPYSVNPIKYDIPPGF